MGEPDTPVRHAIRNTTETGFYLSRSWSEPKHQISTSVSANLLSMPSSKPTSAPFVADERQRQAIEHVYGPMLVVAGAGTGKTTVLTRRIARLIREGHARGQEVLALTYTDNAAREMRERVQQELGSTTDVQAMTFHAYCFMLLERCGKKFGVLDDKDLWVYLRQHIRELNLNYFVRAADVSKFLDDLLDFMRRCQDELVGPERYEQYVRQVERGELPIPRVGRAEDKIPDQEVLGRCREIASVYQTVERMLTEENLGTFGHMITRAYDLLIHDADLVARERTRARFILVDEFQDANFAQVKLLEKLAGDERNIFAVGDPDQAIYRFRGASSAAFGLFQQHFPQAKLVLLEKNQRSLAPILKSAYAVISKNPLIFPAAYGSQPAYQRAPLEPVRTSAAAKNAPQALADPVDVVLWHDRKLECADVVSLIRQKRRNLRCPWKSLAVLYRNHSHRDQLVDELSRWNIPFSIENMDVLDTPEVRDLLACLGAVVSPTDSRSLLRLAALPPFGLDPEKVRAAMKMAGRKTSLAEVLERLSGGAAILARLEEVREHIRSSNLKAQAALNILIHHFELDQNSAALAAVVDFVKGWEKKAITKTGQVGELLDYLSYFREARGSINLANTESDAVRLMTAHGAKGLEFDHIFILRAYKPCFPSSFHEPLFEFPRELRDPTSLAEDESKELNDREERRLFYVAMTRARDSLTIYAKQGTGKDPTPPGFVRDLLKDATLKGWLRRRDARPMQADLFVGEEPGAASLSNASRWLEIDPLFTRTTNLSATALETYETCPLQFKLEREWRIPGETPAAIEYGASMHRVLRTYYDALRFHRPKRDEELLELFRQDLAQANIEDSYQYELYQRQGRQQLLDFLALARRTPPPEVLETEHEFKIRIGQATVVGRIDRVDRSTLDHVVIVDYKTGKPRSQQDADESLQLSIYALAAREIWGHAPDRLVFYNLEDNTMVRSTRSSFQLEQARLKVEDVAEKIIAGKFDAKPGFHCSFCTYRNLCPATEKRLYTIPAKKKSAVS